MVKVVCVCGDVLEFKEDDKSVECQKCNKVFSISKLKEGVFLLR